MGNSSSLASLGVNLALNQRAQQQEEQRLKSERDRRISTIRSSDADARRAEDRALRQRLSSERARAGAAGVGTTGGSIDALLRGLESASATEQASRQARSRQQINELRDSYSSRQRRNLLEFSNRLLSSSGGTTSSRRGLIG